MIGLAISLALSALLFSLPVALVYLSLKRALESADP